MRLFADHGVLPITAAVKQVSIEWIEGRERRLVNHFSLHPGRMASTVKEGDLVCVPPSRHESRTP